jgi:hypothetical protein
MIMIIAFGLGSPKAKAPGWNRITSIATTSSGDPSRIASVSLLRTRISALRRVSTVHCLKAPMRSTGGGPAVAAATLAAAPGVGRKRCAHSAGVASPASRS